MTDEKHEYADTNECPLCGRCVYGEYGSHEKWCKGAYDVAPKDEFADRVVDNRNWKRAVEGVNRSPATHQDNLKAVIDACIAANPEIAELGIGFRVKHFFKGEALIVGVEKYDGDEDDCYWLFFDKLPEKILELSPWNPNWELIGRPITLPDVLLALNDAVASVGMSLSRGDSGRCLMFSDERFSYPWPLPQPLSKVPEETVAYLANLLK